MINARRIQTCSPSQPMGNGTAWLVLGLCLLSGCQCWGPSATCLRPNGPILTRTDALREQHRIRSHYQHEIPAFEAYLSGAPDPHQQLPSRFHPVPTRNVFRTPAPVPTWSAETGGGATSARPDEWANPPTNAPLDLGPGSNGRLPSKDGIEPGTPSLEGPELLPPPRSLGPTTQLGPAGTPSMQTMNAAGPLLHRQMIDYPHNVHRTQKVSDWVRGNYSGRPTETIRLHSALQPGLSPPTVR